MKIALFSDIHANLPALEAFFQNLEKQQPDAVYCLGDLVGYNIWPNEVINEIRKRGIATITGNYDFGIGRSSDDCGCAYKSDEEKANGAVSIRVTNELVGDEERRYLRSLPQHIRLEFEQYHVLLVHGSPRKVNEYLFEDREEASMLRIMGDADILCFGHTHKPYHRLLPGDKHAINIGSVGKPKDGDPRGGYVMLHLDADVRAEFIRFAYDVEQAARAVEESELPDAYAESLRRGV
ncbi:metallophosphatase family protein [Chitinophaga horti]|uniref:Metallophosphatase family protein n=1 Tax=Chitinophaga horti TaxID=2920382 RepID=A0ABY6J8H5_9BACT|nr:metallophosphoesterase family protein [Chitinophaga horti]UYQ95785.1 metallophosphatase family protein [Chitinophaga horti]